jgi:hypothetical protein
MRLWDTTFLCRFKVKFIIRFDRVKCLYARPQFTLHFSQQNEVKKDSFRGCGTLLKALKMPNGLVEDTEALCETSATSCGTSVTSWVVLEVVPCRKTTLEAVASSEDMFNSSETIWRLRLCLKSRQPRDMS